MNKEKLLKVLKYAKKTVQHPEQYKWTPPIYCDGIQLGYPPSSKVVKEQYENRIKTIEEYEEFVKYIDELIKENEI